MAKRRPGDYRIQRKVSADVWEDVRVGLSDTASAIREAKRLALAGDEPAIVRIVRVCSGPMELKHETITRTILVPRKDESCTDSE